MTHDRNYLRMLDDSALRIHATENMTTELEFVLLERLRELRDADAQLEALKNEVVELNARCDLWKAEAAMLQASLDRTDK